MNIINPNLINNNFKNIKRSDTPQTNLQEPKSFKEILETKQTNLQEPKSFKEILETKSETSNIQFSKHASMRLGNRNLSLSNSFSKHASMRLGNRNLSLSNSQMKRVEQGIEKAKAKGINDSLVLVDNIALVVNIKNNIVITAIQNDNEKVYSNIDGAVIV